MISTARLVRVVAIAGVLMAVWCAPALACAIYIRPDPATAKQADAVVVGKVTKLRRDIAKWKTIGPGGGGQSNNARLTVEIDEVISGAAAPVITVSWREMLNNGPPDRLTGDHLFALKKLPNSAQSRDAYEVVQGLCTGALVYPRGSAGANAIRAVFGMEAERPEAPQNVSADVPWLALALGGFLGLGGLLIAARIFLRRRARNL